MSQSATPSKFFTALRFLGGLWLTVFIAIGVSVAVDRYAPLWEGNIAPVVSTAEITNVEIVTPMLTRIWLKSTKLRDCRYEDIEWWYGDQPPGGAIRIAVYFEGAPATRPKGEMLLGPWLVSMPAEALVSNSFAYVTHRCHVLWNTRTLFFDSTYVGEVSPIQY